MEFTQNKLRVYHNPQLGSPAGSFNIDVFNEAIAYKIMRVLAEQHLWLYENRIIPDYANIIGIEMFDPEIDSETGEPYGWCNYFNEKEDMEWEEFEETYSEQMKQLTS